MQDVFRAIGRLQPEHRHGADHRRVGLRQGAGRQRAAQAQPARQRPVRRHQHRGDPEGPARVGAVRPRARRLHRRADDAPRPLRAGRRRHALPRRDRRHAVRPADAPAARARRTASSIASAATTRCAATCASSPRPTRTSRSGSRPARSARTCSIASTSSGCACRRCASASEDIPPLTRFFLQKSARELGVEGKRITDAALARLTQFDFPGNVRQLENICHWLTVMAPAQLVDAKDLPPELQRARQRREPRRRRARPRRGDAPATPLARGSDRGARWRRDRRRAPTAAAPSGARPTAGRSMRAGSPASSSEARELLRAGRADGLGHADARASRRS